VLATSGFGRPGRRPASAAGRAVGCAGRASGVGTPAGRDRGRAAPAGATLGGAGSASVRSRAGEAAGPASVRSRRAKPRCRGQEGVPRRCGPSGGPAGSALRAPAQPGGIAAAPPGGSPRLRLGPVLATGTRDGGPRALLMDPRGVTAPGTPPSSSSRGYPHSPHRAKAHVAPLRGLPRGTARARTGRRTFSHGDPSEGPGPSGWPGWRPASGVVRAGGCEGPASGGSGGRARHR
jgi:hypothetical protein